MMSTETVCQPLRQLQGQPVKRLVDILIACVVLTLASPLLLFIGVLVKITSPGPVIYRASRLGRGGHRFQMLKFRTMVSNQSAVMPDALVHSSHDMGILVKMAGDPRVTRLGAFLRRASLDELPQFVNVLRGEMSVVGPRPLPDFMLRAGRECHVRRRSRVRPGITGLWQVSARHRNTRLSDMLPYDLYYVRHQSLWLDIQLMARTVMAVLSRNGAM